MRGWICIGEVNERIRRVHVSIRVTGRQTHLAQSGGQRRCRGLYCRLHQTLGERGGGIDGFGKRR